jgi:hypothetical protein
LRAGRSGSVRQQGEAGRAAQEIASCSHQVSRVSPRAATKIRSRATA